MSDTMKDGTPIAERWAETYAGIEYAAQCCDGWIDGEDELAKQLIEELSRAESELAEANLYAAKLKAEMGKLNDKVARLEAPVIPSSDELERFRSSYFANGKDWKENTFRILARWEERDRPEAIAARAKEQP